MQDLIESTFAEAVGLPRATVFAADTTLADIVKQSPTLTNSIDLMEAFARTASALRRAYQIRVRLPSFPLDTKIADVFAAFTVEASIQLAAQAAAPVEAL